MTQAMHPVPAADWISDYTRIASELPQLARDAPVTLAGMGTCIDAVCPLADLARLDPRSGPPELTELIATLTARAATGTGGEIRFDWPGGPAFLRERLPLQLALGGTGPQAGRVLASLGAPVLIALEDRSAYMLDQVPAGISLADGDHMVGASQIIPRGAPRPEIYIFEFTRNVPVGVVLPPRSSRIIVRFCDLGLDHDPDFANLSVRLAGEAGAGLLSGFSAVHASKIKQQLARTLAIAGAWRAAGLRTVHLELATFADIEVLKKVLDAVPGNFNSLGMSESEFARQVTGKEAGPQTMAAVADRLGLDRLCVHADRWAAAVTRGDPDRERDAMLCGSLLAATRAATGSPTLPSGLPEGAEFARPPFPEHQPIGARTFVSVASPYLTAPLTTLGLGDTFTAGCLLVLGQRDAPSDPARN